MIATPVWPCHCYCWTGNKIFLSFVFSHAPCLCLSPASAKTIRLIVFQLVRCVADDARMCIGAVYRHEAFSINKNLSNFLLKTTLSAIASSSSLQSQKTLTLQTQFVCFGNKVTILEASDRVGGRVQTYRNEEDGWYAELGAMRIPDFHKWVNIIYLCLQTFDRWGQVHHTNLSHCHHFIRSGNAKIMTFCIINRWNLRWIWTFVDACRSCSCCHCLVT